MLKTFTCLAVLFSFTLTSAQAGEPIATYGDAWLEKIGEYPVVHLKGSEREMGVQLGYLAGDLLDDNIHSIRDIAEKNVGPFMKYVPNSLFRGLRRIIGLIFWWTYPKDVKTHIKGVIEGAKKRPDRRKLNKLDLAFLNSVIEIVGVGRAVGDSINKEPGAREFMSAVGIPDINTNCDTFAAWGPRTVGGKTFQTRNTDIDTGKGLEKYPLIMVIKRDGKIPVVATSIAGLVGVISGMNAHGVALGQVWAFSKQFKIHTPWQLQVREIFMNAKTAKEAVDMFSRMRRTAYGSNFVFADQGDGADGMNSEGFAIESTAKQWSVFGPNDPRELELKFNGESVGLPIPYAVVRGDLVLDPKIRAKQSGVNGPTGDPRVAKSYKERYKGQVDRILAYEQQGVLIGPEQAIAISRETAMRGANLQNTVYANTDRELWVTYSKMHEDGSVTQAYEREYVHIPFYEYIPTIERNSKTKNLEIHTYLESKKTPRDFIVRVSRGGKSVTDATVSTEQNIVPVKLSEPVQRGDLVELIDAKAGTLVDRLAI